MNLISVPFGMVSVRLVFLDIFSYSQVAVASPAQARLLDLPARRCGKP